MRVNRLRTPGLAQYCQSSFCILLFCWQVQFEMISTEDAEFDEASFNVILVRDSELRTPRQYRLLPKLRVSTVCWCGGGRCGTTSHSNDWCDGGKCVPPCLVTINVAGPVVVVWWREVRCQVRSPEGALGVLGDGEERGEDGVGKVGGEGEVSEEEEEEGVK